MLNKPIRFAHVGDLHIGPHHFEAGKQAWSDAVDKMIGLDLDFAVLCGDLYHTSEIGGGAYSTGQVEEALCKPLARLAEKMNVVIVKGNHDEAGGGKLHGLMALKHYYDVRVIDRVEVFEKFGVLFCVFPWTDKAFFLAGKPDLHGQAADDAYQDSINSALAGFKSRIAAHDGPSLFVSHCEIRGCKPNPQYVQVGGRFAFNRHEIEDLGAWRVLLGHIHMQSDERPPWYPGALFQNNFGERGNITGFAVQTLGGVGEGWKWHNVPSPRFFVSVDPTDEEIADLAADNYNFHRVELSGDLSSKNRRLLDANPNCEFKSKKTYKPSTRIQIDVTPSSDPFEMAMEWIATNNSQVPKLLEAGIFESREEITPIAKDLASKVTTQLVSESKSIGRGGGLQLKRLRLANIGPHAELDIDFTDYDKLVAVTGSNGKGKTFFLESIVAAIFDKFPSRGISAKGGISQGKTKGEIELFFAIGGQDYRILRRLGSTSEHFLYEGEGAEKPKAGPLMGDFQDQIAELFGGMSVFLSCAFSAQDGTGDLIAVTSHTKRKNIFAELLGYEHLTEYSKVAAGMASDFKIDASYKGGQIDEKLRRLEGHEKDVELLPKNKEGVEWLKNKVGEAKVTLEAAIKEKDKLSVLSENPTTKLAEAEAAENRFFKEYENAVEAVKACIKIISKKEEHEKLSSHLMVRMQKRTRIEQANSFAAANLSDRMRINHEIESVRQSKVALVSRRNQHVHNIDAEIQAIKSSAGKLSDVPCGGEGDYAGCTLISAATKSRDQLKELEATRESRVNAINSELTNRSEEKDREMTAMSKTLEELPSAPASGDLSAAIESENESRIAATNLSHIVEKEQGLPRLKEAADQWKQQGIENRKRVDELKEQFKLYSKALEMKTKIESTYREAHAVADDVHGKYCAAQSVLDGLEKSVAEIPVIQKEIETAEAELLSIKKNEAVASLLSDGWGVDGVQANLIDNAASHITETMNTKLLKDTPFEFFIETQRALAKNLDIKEVFEFKAALNGRIQKLREFSGGEQRFVKNALRVAIAIHQSRQSNTPIGTFFMDEALDNLDSDRAHMMVQIYQAMQEEFYQTFLVSHAHELLATIPSRIEF